MKFAWVRNAPGSFLILGTLCAVTVISASPGFGGFGGLRKKTLDLKTRQPAPVRLANTSIAFKGAFTNPEYAPVLGSLLIALGTELISNEKTLIEKEKPEDAAWVLGMTVTGFSVSPPQPYTEGTGNTSLQYMRWIGSLNVAYQVLDHSGRVHDAGNVAANYNKDFPVSAVGRASKSTWPLPGMHKNNNNTEKVPGSVEDVKQELINDVKIQIASKLGNTTRPIEVQIATGDSHLDRAGEFLDQQLWSRALDELEKTPAFPKTEQEAYRQYDLGLAYEAISYSSSNANDQKENIYKAAEYYDKALEMNQKEKYFVATVARTRDALARYKDLDRMAKQDQAVGGSSAGATPTPREDARASTSKPGAVPAPQPAPGQTATKALTVIDVVEMYNEKVSEDQIVDVIQGSAVEFNPHDKDTVIAIAKAKLPVRIQNALRTKVGAPLLKAAPAAPKPALAKAQ